MIDLPTGARLDLLETGTGQTPVVLLHGLLGTPRRNFPRLIDWLTPEYRLIAPTLRGYGRSGPKPRDFPPDFYQRDADDVLALLDVLAIERAHLLGYSDGGEAALCCAVTDPTRFQSVVVWGAVGHFGPAIRPAAQKLFPASWISDDEREIHDIQNPDGFILRWIKAVHRIIDTGGDISYGRAGQLHAPLLLLLGEQDTLNPVSAGRAYVARAPQARLVTFPCGHPIHDEQWPDFQTTVGDFLAQHAG